MNSGADDVRHPGLVLNAFRALRPAVDADRVGRLLCPPYDVIDAATRDRLVAGDPDNLVAVILPDPTPEGYATAARTLSADIVAGTLAVDPEPALYVYEMTGPDGRATRGIVGAVELRAPEDGVILPHENTMAGPVADRLSLMLATGADLEPIYLIYDGGGAASDLVHDVDEQEPIAHAHTPDEIVHRLWAVSDPDVLADVAADLSERRALIADGHHRYATYRERQRVSRAEAGDGVWDFGLALLVDSAQYGPQVHAIHRVVPGLTLTDAARGAQTLATVEPVAGTVSEALASLDSEPGFAAVITDGRSAFRITDPAGTLLTAARRDEDDEALTRLDVTVLHRAVVERAWGLPDDVDHVSYAHSVEEAEQQATRTSGIAVLLRPTEAAAVAAVAAAGARMPRKSTLFTPKPASGLFMRRLDDQAAT